MGRKISDYLAFRQLIATSASGTNSLSCSLIRLRPANNRYHYAADPTRINKTRTRNVAAKRASKRQTLAWPTKSEPRLAFAFPLQVTTSERVQERNPVFGSADRLFKYTSH